MSFDFSPQLGEAPLPITFTNTTTNGATYQWYFGDNDTSSLVNPVHTYSNAGSYDITLITENTCGSDTLTKQILIISIDDISKPKLISVFPNPSNGVIYYKVNLPEKGKFQLLNITGKLIQEMNIEHASGEIDISNYAKGIYILKFISKNNSQVVKITLQ